MLSLGGGRFPLPSQRYFYVSYLSYGILYGTSTSVMSFGVTISKGSREFESPATTGGGFPLFQGTLDIFGEYGVWVTEQNTRRTQVTLVTLVY